MDGWFLKSSSSSAFDILFFERSKLERFLHLEISSTTDIVFPDKFKYSKLFKWEIFSILSIRLSWRYLQIKETKILTNTYIYKQAC